MGERTTATDRIRRTIELSRDPRVARTRRSIVDAVHSLARDGATSIGVADIVRTAGISKATLYTHFAGLDQLALYIFEEAIGTMTTPVAHAGGKASTREHVRHFVAQLVAHYVDNRVFYSAVLAMPVSLEVNSRAVDWIAAALIEWMRDLPAPAGLIPDVVAVYTGSAIVGMLDAWTRHEVELTPEQATAHLLRLMPDWLTGP